MALITVVYRNYSILNDFFESFNKQTKSNFAIFIADLTPSEEENKSQYVYPENVRIIRGENKGYAYGINLWLRKLLKQGYNYFSVINSDVTVASDFVTNTLSSLYRHPQSLIGGKIYYSQGYEYHKNQYRAEDLGRVIWYAGGYIDWGNVIARHRGVDEVDRGQYQRLEETGFISGCLISFSKDVVKQIGFWDEGYFLYYEDADYCQRAKRMGLKLYYDPSIVIWHKNAQSTGGSGSRFHQEQQGKSRLRFGLKYAPFRTKVHLLKNYFLTRLKED